MRGGRGKKRKTEERDKAEIIRGNEMSYSNVREGKEQSVGRKMDGER